jgi:hypothetical protein
MDNVRLRNPLEIPLYIFSVLVNLLIIAFIVAGALLLGFLNALAGEPLSGPVASAKILWWWGWTNGENACNSSGCYACAFPEFSEIRPHRKR